jgi:hypothetical protein
LETDWVLCKISTTAARNSLGQVSFRERVLMKTFSNERITSDRQRIHGAENSFSMGRKERIHAKEEKMGWKTDLNPPDFINLFLQMKDAFPLPI